MTTQDLQFKKWEVCRYVSILYFCLHSNSKKVSYKTILKTNTLSHYFEAFCFGYKYFLDTKI